MKCPVCKRKLKEHVEQCPYCMTPLGESLRGITLPSRRTAICIVTGVLALLLGGALALFMGVLFAFSIGPTIDVMRGLPLTDDFFAVMVIADEHLQALPMLLYTFSVLMWALAGVVLLFGGVFSLATGGGERQFPAAVVLMLFAFFAQLTAAILLGQNLVSDTSGIFESFSKTIENGLSAYVLQFALILMSVVMTILKRKDVKSLKKQYARQREMQRKAIHEPGLAQAVIQDSAVKTAQDTPVPTALSDDIGEQSTSK